MTKLAQNAQAERSEPDAAIVDRLFTGHAAKVMQFPDRLGRPHRDLAALLDCGGIDQGKNPWPTYEAYLDDIQAVWTQCGRVLRPNGKLCINAPIMPIPKAVIEQHTRHLKNIAFDMEHWILGGTDLERYSLFVWQKQTSKMMFGSYPYPGNIIENNTIEFINVYVKPGKPPKFATDVKAQTR